jgi:3-oxoacyl-[acyl-carrier protein] reductase
MNLEQESKLWSALITGASRGIGAAAARALRTAGIREFVLQYNRYQQGAEELQADLLQSGATCTLIQGDLSRQEGIDATISAWRESGTQPQILVNNAGSLVQRARLAEFTPELFDRVMTLNVKSAWLLTQAVAPVMIAQGRGIIVNVSSIAGRNGGGLGATVYAGAKAAITSMTKGLARELAPQGIRVNAVSPGTVDNYFHEQFSNRQILDSVVANTPAGRLGTNEEMADVIVFLCSEAARYVHGQTIEVNGGMLAP